MTPTYSIFEDAVAALFVVTVRYGQCQSTELGRFKTKAEADKCKADHKGQRG